MRNHSQNKAVSATVALIAVVLVAVVVGSTAYYFGTLSTKSSGQKSTVLNTNSEIVTSTMLHTTTVTQEIAVNSNSGNKNNNATLSMSPTSSCVSVDNSCSGSGYSIAFTNGGDTVVSGGSIELYFGNGTVVYGNTPCTFGSTILPEYSFNCTGSTPPSVPPYSDIVISVMYPNGKSYSYTYTPPGPPLSIISAVLTSGVTGDNNTVAASASLTLTFLHIGSPVQITGFSIIGENTLSGISGWSTTPTKASGNWFYADNNNQITKDGKVTIVLYPISQPSSTISQGDTFSYSIVYGFNTLSGSITAQ